MDEKSLRIILGKLGVQVAKKDGKWLRASCPLAAFFHKGGKDNNPSFGASTSEDISGYFCHGCHMHGTISALARLLGHHKHGNQFYYTNVIEEADAADRENLVFGAWDDIRVERDIPQEPLVEEIFANMYEDSFKVEEAKAYLTSRGIGEYTSYTLGLRWDGSQNRILFPVRGPDSNLYGFTGRGVRSDIEPKIRDYAGLKKRQHILGCNRWDWNNDQKPLIIVEGLFGFAHLVELNMEKIADIGALLGSYLTKPKEELIIQRNTKTYLLTDNDAAGDQCLFGRCDAEGNHDIESGAAYKLSKHIPIYVPEWPEGLDDPDQLSKKDIWYMINNTDLWSTL